MAKKKTENPRIENRKARHNYHIHEKIEVGIVLQGSEVKSVRDGQVSLQEGFARIEPNSMEMFLHEVHIAPYSHASGVNGHDPTRLRKLLAHKREIKRIFGQTTAKGTTLIPLNMYFVRGRVKLEIGVCTGKKSYDKREDLKSKDARREIQKAMTRRRI